MSVALHGINKPKFIVIASNGIGGAEKRFFDIYCTLVERNPLIHFVAPGLLLDKLDMVSVSSLALNNIIRLEMPSWSQINLIRALFPLIRSLPKGSAFHYPLNPVLFLHLLQGHRLSISLCDCTRTPYLNWKNKNDFLEFFALHFAYHVDVLSPDVYEKLQHNLPSVLTKKLSLTPQGTYVNHNAFYVAENKQRDVIFLSRLEEQKGITDWLDLLPDLWRRFMSCPWSETMRFLICGSGTLGDMAASRIAELRSIGIPVWFLGMIPPADVLARGRVVVSLQRHTNFPSRVVGEALLSGCFVVIRKTGDSHKFGNPEGITYIPAKLEIDNVYSVIEPLLSLSNIDNQNYAYKIRKDAVILMSASKSIDYFSAILDGRTG